MIYIYKITNKTNGKVYIGQTVNPTRRWSRHRSDSKNITHPLYDSMRLHGLDNFTYEVISNCDTQEAADQTETDFISQFQSRDREYGYNLEPGGQGHCIVSEETRAKIGAAHRAFLDSGGTHGRKGKKLSPETIALRTATRKRLGSATKGFEPGHKTWNKGMPKEDNPLFGRTKLTQEQKDELKLRLTAGETQEALAKEYGVSRRTIRRYTAK